MNKTRRTFPDSLKREAVEQVLAGTPLRHVAQTFEITESLLGKWKRQFQEAGICQSASNSFQVSASKFFQLLRLI